MINNLKLKINQNKIFLILIFILIFLRPHLSFIPDFYSVYIFDLVLLFLLMIYFSIVKKIKFKYINFYRVLIISLFILLIITIINLFFQSFSIKILFNYFRILYYYLFLIFLIEFFENNNMNLLLFNKYNNIIFGIIFIISLIQLLELPFLSDIIFNLYGTIKLRTIWSGYPRIYSTFYNANWFGVYILYYLSFSLSLYEKKIINNKSFIIRFFLLITLLAFSGSRTALVGVLVILFIYFLSNFRFKSVILFILLVATLFSIFFYLSEYVSLFQKTYLRFYKIYIVIKDFKLTNENLNILSGQRYTSWKKALTLFLNKPIIGYGDTKGTPHNSYLTILLTWGGVGLLVFLYNITYLYFSLLFRRKISVINRVYSKFLLYFLSSFLIVSLAADFIFSSQVFLMLLIPIALYIKNSHNLFN